MKMAGFHYYEIKIRNSPLKISRLLQLKWHIIMIIPLGALYITCTWFSAQMFSNILIILIICSLPYHLDFYKNWHSCELMRHKIETWSWWSFIFLTEGSPARGRSEPLRRTLEMTWLTKSYTVTIDQSGQHLGLSFPSSVAFFKNLCTKMTSLSMFNILFKDDHCCVNLNPSCINIIILRIFSCKRSSSTSYNLWWWWWCPHPSWNSPFTF